MWCSCLGASLLAKNPMRLLRQPTFDGFEIVIQIVIPGKAPTTRFKGRFSITLPAVRLG
jgi:hypothetical protein